jgi:hypothetical protein
VPPKKKEEKGKEKCHRPSMGTHNHNTTIILAI